MSNGYWPLVVVVCAVLFFGYCVISANEGRRSFENTVEDTFRSQRCYSRGLESVLFELPSSPPYDDDTCAESFYRGVTDGEDVYDGN